MSPLEALFDDHTTSSDRSTAHDPTFVAEGSNRISKEQTREAKAKGVSLEVGKNDEDLDGADHAVSEDLEQRETIK